MEGRAKRRLSRSRLVRPAPARQAIRALAVALLFAAAPGTPGEAQVGRSGAGVALPTGDVFTPLLADPKQPEFLASVLWVRSAVRNTEVAAVGFGESFGLWRWPGPRRGDGVQVALAGGVFAQFDLRTESFDLLNADYVIGVPLTYRRGVWSGRVRLYHQSSHLGDEFLLQAQPQRVNLSFEAVEVVVSLDIGRFRLYGGGEYLVRREPADFRPRVIHGGVEYRQTTPLPFLGRLGGGRLVVGLDAKSWEQDDWWGAWAGRAGLEFGPRGTPSGDGRRIRVLFHFYDGPSPYGQFYTYDVSSLGIGVHFSL